MGINVAKIKEIKNLKKGYSLQDGVTKLYILPPLEGADFPWTEFWMHYNINGKKLWGSCINLNKNPIYRTPQFAEELTKRDKKLSKICYICSRSNTIKTDTRLQFLLPVLPLSYKPIGSDQFYDLKVGFNLIKAPKVIIQSLIDIIDNYGDISDPKRAVFIMVNRTGKEQQTKYQVMVDPETSMKPHVFSKENIEVINKTLLPGGALDPLIKLSYYYKDYDEQRMMLNGVEIEKEEVLPECECEQTIPVEVNSSNISIPQPQVVSTGDELGDSFDFSPEPSLAGNEEPPVIYEEETGEVIETPKAPVKTPVTQNPGVRDLISKLNSMKRGKK